MDVTTASTAVCLGGFIGCPRDCGTLFQVPEDGFRRGERHRCSKCRLDLLVTIEDEAYGHTLVRVAKLVPAPMPDDVHVVPTFDGKEHDTTSAQCWCGSRPLPETLDRDLYRSTVWVHKVRQ